MLKKALSLDVVTVCIVLTFSSPPPPQLTPSWVGVSGVPYALLPGATCPICTVKVQFIKNCISLITLS